MFHSIQQPELGLTVLILGSIDLPLSISIAPAVFKNTAKYHLLKKLSITT